MAPETRVPVTTAPSPFKWKARSSGSLAGREGRAAARRRLPGGLLGGSILPGDLEEGLLQEGQPGAGGRRDREDGRAGEGGAGQELLDLQLGDLQEVGVHEVGLGQGHEPGRDAEERADRQVLPGLRLDPLVRRHHEEHDADAAQAGQSVVEEALVSGDVHEADLEVPLGQVGEADIDRDAARLLLGPAVAVDPGESQDEAGLPVVDMAGGTDDDAWHPWPPTVWGSKPRGRPG